MFYLPTEQASKVNPFPCPTTYRHALLHYVDITSLVRTNVLKELSEYCRDEKDKQHLNNITAPTDEGQVCYIEKYKCIENYKYINTLRSLHKYIENYKYIEKHKYIEIYKYIIYTHMVDFCRPVQSNTYFIMLSSYP